MFPQTFPALRRLALLVALALVAGISTSPTAGPALAQASDTAPGPFKSLPEGTFMVWENMDTGKRVEGIVGRTRGMIVSWIWEGRSFSSFAHICMDCVVAGLPPDGGDLGQLFPLQVGKSIGFTRRWAGEGWRDRIEVLASEQVTVPAGTFEAFVLLRVSEHLGSDWRAEQRTWYAPELGWVVKFEGYNNKGGGERWQAVSFD